MKNKIKCMVISMLFFATIFSVAVTANDDWTMYGHDAQNSRYSTSDAPDTKNILWSSPTNEKIISSPAVVDDKVFVGSYDYNVYCFNSQTGDVVWNYTTGDSVRSSPAVYNGLVYVYSNDGNLYYLNADDGTYVDSYSIGGTISSSPTVAYDKVFFTSANGKIFCFEADSATEVWNVSVGSDVVSTVAVANDCVYVSSTVGDIFCLSAGDGSEIWMYTSGSLTLSSPAVVDDKVYLGSMSPSIYCLDAIGNGDGTTDLIWDYPVTGTIQSSPAVAEGMVFLNTKNSMYCLDAGDGSEQWTYDTGNAFMYQSSPAVADGKVYFCSGTTFGTIFCLNITNGNLIWKHDINAGIKSSPAIANGNLYVGSEDFNLYCFGVEPTFPEIVISSIEGGSGITATIENAGDADATDVQWSITIEGGLFILEKEIEGSFELISAGDSEEIHMDVLGIGLGIITPLPTITVTAECAEDSSDTQSVSAKIFFKKVTVQ